YMQALQTPFTF
nr:immunoglobulin light chain junction region [Macaca mulatta]MPN95577.1 immunoglobulin light chain junction region [Macaca mulatta]MPN95603.1 immunoglobulin light chain junction region [Macaca mulatta]MPN98580.1 immunoglobulin light chain junction region [Macaca mulatta]MPN98681.1 immunoglobulin light chain junction region [Macaca mulatta]